jgi:putative resolvase
MEKLYSLKEAKQLLGVKTRTIQQWDRDGKLKVVRTLGGRRRIPESEIMKLQGELLQIKATKTIGYARVSSESQKDDLNRQIEILKSKGIKENDILYDISSGLNEKRRNYKKLLKMVMSREVSKIIITYPDRLTRFGFNTLIDYFTYFDVSVEVINENVYQSPQEELVKDLITLVAHFSGKLYGMRSHKQKEVIENVKNILS